MAELPNRIRELRVARDWSQDRLAEKVGCSKAQVSDLERGNRGLDLEWMRRIATALGVPPADLLNRNDNPFLLDDDERALVERYRNADKAQRETLERVVQAVVPNERRKVRAA